MPVFHDACGFHSHASSDDAQLLSVGWSCPHFPSPTRGSAAFLQHHKADSQCRGAGLCRVRRAAWPAGRAAKHHRLAMGCRRTPSHKDIPLVSISLPPSTGIYTQSQEGKNKPNSFQRQTRSRRGSPNSALCNLHYSVAPCTFTALA